MKISTIPMIVGTPYDTLSRRRSDIEDWILGNPPTVSEGLFFETPGGHSVFANRNRVFTPAQFNYPDDWIGFEQHKSVRDLDANYGGSDITSFLFNV